MRPAATVHVVGAAIVEGAEVLVAQRGESMSLAGSWEFPGGKVEPGETPEESLAREIMEELGCRVVVGELLGTGHALAGEKTVTLDVYLCRLVAGTPAASEHAELRWCSAAQLPHLAWAEADVPILPAVRRVLLDA